MELGNATRRQNQQEAGNDRYPNREVLMLFAFEDLAKWFIVFILD